MFISKVSKFVMYWPIMTKLVSNSVKMYSFLRISCNCLYIYEQLLSRTPFDKRKSKVKGY